MSAVHCQDVNRLSSRSRCEELTKLKTWRLVYHSEAAFDIQDVPVESRIKSWEQKVIVYAGVPHE
jgi:hypothetical protein